MLKAWLAQQNRSRTEIAEDIGISAVSLWRIAEGKQFPSTRVALAIERVAGIPALSWASDAIQHGRAA